VAESRLVGPVRVVGTGLLGTSIALGLCGRGVEIVLDDISPSNLRLAIDYGAGRVAAVGDNPQLIVVCTPPDVTAGIVARELGAYPSAIVTDVASVKCGILTDLREQGADISRYLGSHPMAGRERGGVLSGRADLFMGRPWVIALHDRTGYQQIAAVDDLILDLGATPVEMTPEEHDAAVALVSHVPQVVSSLMGRRLVDASHASVNLAGQGLRDVTRIAASDPEMWVQILGANAHAVRNILTAYRNDLDHFITVLETPDAPGARRAMAEELTGGQTGVERLPGKHGRDQRFAELIVMVDDCPGQLGRLFTDMGEIGVNLEEIRLEHSPGAPIGIAEISVMPNVKQRTIDGLSARGWRIAE
jgi:prephenate dehydrogenase